MEDDRRRWDERYALAEVEQIRPQPPDALVRPHDLTGEVARTGRALDVACGLGRQAVWAAERGLRVDALDVSPIAVGHATALARRHGVADRVRVRVHDLGGSLPGELDPEYHLVICQRFRAPALYPVLLERLAPGGIAAITVLSAVGHGGDPGPYRAQPGELERHVAGTHGLTVLSAAESDGEASIVVRRVG